MSIAGACLATPTPFAIKGVRRVVLAFPAGPLSLQAEGCWQREVSGDELLLTGVAFPAPTPEALDALWDAVFSAGQKLARFLHERTRLHELGVEEALGLAQLSRTREVPAGRFLYRQDRSEPGSDSIFLVMRGRVALQVRVRGSREMETERLEVGALFGGLPLLGAVDHADSAAAVEDARLLEIDRAAFRYLRVAKPWLGYRLSQLLLRQHAERLTRLTARLRDEL